MVTLLVFAVTLLFAVLLSELARRSIISTAVLFLLVGFVAGGLMGWIDVDASHPVVSRFSELALFSVLFTDGMRMGVKDLLSAWRLPGRALLFGMPITVVTLAALSYWIVGLSLMESLLVGAVLSPTDPVFASAIVGRDEIPERVRRLLNIESGVNDGLALPLVLILLGLASGTNIGVAALAGEVLLGIAIGVIIPWLALGLEQTRYFAVAKRYEPFDAFAVGLLILAITSLTHANEFLAAFVGGVTIASRHPSIRDQFHEFGERLTELLKLAALLVFGALLSPHFLAEVRWQDYLFTIVAVFLVRPWALSLALIGSPLRWREWLIAAWFGPRGFASVVFGLIVLQSGIDSADRIFHLIAIAVAISIIIHSSTDVIMSRKLYGGKTQKAPA